MIKSLSNSPGGNTSPSSGSGTKPEPVDMINPVTEKYDYSGIKVGDTIKLGTYEQDNNKSNGKEEIEWRVLDIDGNEALLISEYALDCKPYNEEYAEITWEDFTLR